MIATMRHALAAVLVLTACGPGMPEEPEDDDVPRDIYAAFDVRYPQGSTPDHVDVLIGDQRGKTFCVLMVKRAELPLQHPSWVLTMAISEVERYASMAGAQFGALALLLSLPPETEEPRIESVKGPGGRDLLILHL